MKIETSGVNAVSNTSQRQRDADVGEPDESGRQKTRDDHEAESAAVGRIDERDRLLASTTRGRHGAPDARSQEGAKAQDGDVEKGAPEPVGPLERFCWRGKLMVDAHRRLFDRLLCGRSGTHLVAREGGRGRGKKEGGRKEGRKEGGEVVVGKEGGSERALSTNSWSCTSLTQGPFLLAALTPVAPRVSLSSALIALKEEKVRLKIILGASSCCDPRRPNRDSAPVMACFSSHISHVPSNIVRPPLLEDARAQQLSAAISTHGSCQASHFPEQGSQFLEAKEGRKRKKGVAGRGRRGEGRADTWLLTDSQE